MICFLEIIGFKPVYLKELHTIYAAQPTATTLSNFSANAQKRAASEAWLSLLSGEINKKQRKRLLGLMPNDIAPWFTRPEVLMDFLTDSFNAGGSVSLMALAGLFYLIKEKNLDYPQFYQKLYSLLDFSILHSKHRSRFFRLLNTFLSSTHLPAVLVASFIKRLSRLCIYAPPSAIVVVVPWVYNLLRTHPTCTFMIHRTVRRNDSLGEIADHLSQDPFDMNEQDPLQADAIKSSLWEIDTLQTHYQPNVAAIARIISEQFTKETYNIEDFLDHSYSSVSIPLPFAIWLIIKCWTQMLDAELLKELRKPLVAEYEIPKHIFTRPNESSEGRESLVDLWDY